MGYRMWMGLVVILLALAPVYGLVTVNPQKYEIRSLEFNKTYNVIVTLINQDAFPYDVQAVVGRESDYLSDYVKLEPTHFTLAALEKKNMKLALSVPSTLSPEEHIFTLQFLAANQELGTFTLTFVVPGEKVEDLVVEQVALSRERDLAYFDFALSNAGNVIARGSPIVELSRGDEKMATFGQESTIIVLPDQRYNLTLIYDTSSMQSGAYSYKAYVRYNQKDSNIRTGEFVIEKKVAAGESAQMTAAVGEMVTIPVTIQNPSEKLSFYRISSTIGGKEQVLEGQLQERSKEVAVLIDTTEMDSGTYPVELYIRSGRNLEDSESRTVNLVLHQGSESAWLIWLTPLPLIGSIVALVLWLRPRVAARRRHTSLSAEARTLSQDYDRLEHSLKGLAKDIHSFIDDSNRWLALRGHHGFR
jgi:hypothetical protein